VAVHKMKKIKEKIRKILNLLLRLVLFWVVLFLGKQIIAATIAAFPYGGFKLCMFNPECNINAIVFTLTFFVGLYFVISVIFIWRSK